MNRFAKISVIATLSALSFGGISYAAGVEMNWPDQIDRTVRNFKGDNFRIVDVDTLSRMNETRARIDAETPQQLAALHTAVDGNRALAAKLKARNVEMNNIAGASQAADGGLTLYVR
ncbi:hypothetical protein [Sinorhizobium terangae]|uniref:Uncharacterized protein n=1 Tax=Sinorhizobium terangae TaxID=110322 RepID=A0A6N7L7M0_SINTE|nr:hypothetical protein [Sinorhizobium terangae]MBB4185186.1 hypothetical protein [Sinorhizobium terangae]MQX13791.1 hypothetical protein [Sinorhizobium terangae]WFU48632.1 hypothetical protein QA637_04195 [Sinorhizobium terangae]